MKQLKELEDTNFIQPVSIENGPEKKIGFRRKLNVLHKGSFPHPLLSSTVIVSGSLTVMPFLPSS